MTIFKRIKSLRESLEMAQEELALKTGYKSRSTINKIESGLRDINQSQIESFARALNVSPAYLMGWEDEEDSAPATLSAVQQRLGHRDVKTTLGIYNHVTRQKESETADIFASYIDN